MLSTAIALNRFGLGARPGDPLPADPRSWLLGQLKAFQPRPQAFVSLPTRRDLAADIAEYIGEERAFRRKARGAQMLDAGMPRGANPDQKAGRIRCAARCAATCATPMSK